MLLEQAQDRERVLNRSLETHRECAFRRQPNVEPDDAQLGLQALECLLQRSVPGRFSPCSPVLGDCSLQLPYHRAEVEIDGAQLRPVGTSGETRLQLAAALASCCNVAHARSYPAAARDACRGLLGRSRGTALGWSDMLIDDPRGRAKVNDGTGYREDRTRVEREALPRTVRSVAGKGDRASLHG